MNPYLALDTSGDCLSLALGHDDGTVLAERHQASLQNDSLEELIRGLLKDRQCSIQELAGLLFACGPGSFTGLRICAACVQGICLGAELCAWPIPSLEAAQAGIQARTGKEFPVVLRRARKGEWYVGIGDEEGSLQTCALSSAEIMKKYSCIPIAVCGNEQDGLLDEQFAAQPDFLKQLQFFPHEPCASGLLSIFAKCTPEQKASLRLASPGDFSNFHPLYLTPVSARTLAQG